MNSLPATSLPERMPVAAQKTVIGGELPGAELTAGLQRDSASAAEVPRNSDRGTGVRSKEDRSFAVDLPVFSGPFDALLSLIANKRLDLTELALSEVTGEFLEYVRTLSLRDDVDEVSSFVDVASILLDAKSASLLPHTASDEPDERDLEALRERDLLFARLLQYRAFQRVSVDFSRIISANSARFAHHGIVDQSVADLAPGGGLNISPSELAAIAVAVFTDAPTESMAVAQLHVPLVDLREQSELVRSRLRSVGSSGSLFFDDLVRDATSTLEVVARFLAILLYFKEGSVQFKQQGPFRPLELRWV